MMTRSHYGELYHRAMGKNASRADCQQGWGIHQAALAIAWPIPRPALSHPHWRDFIKAE